MSNTAFEPAAAEAASAAAAGTRELYPLRPNVHEWLYAPDATARQVVAATVPEHPAAHDEGVLPGAVPGHPARGVLSDEPEHLSLIPL